MSSSEFIQMLNKHAAQLHIKYKAVAAQYLTKRVAPELLTPVHRVLVVGLI